MVYNTQNLINFTHGYIVTTHAQSIRQRGNERLYNLVEEMLRSNQHLAARISGLSVERFRVSETTSSASFPMDGGSTSKAGRRASKPLSFVESAYKAIRFTFECDLESSRVYRRALPSDHQSDDDDDDIFYVRVDHTI